MHLPPPQAPVATRFRRWLRQEPRRVRNLKWSLAVFLAALLFLVTGPTGFRTIQGFRARRASAEASRLVDHGEYARAGRRISDAIALRSSEPAVWQATAHFLSRTGQGHAALRWWKKISETRSLTVSEHRDYAKAALRSNEFILAAEQIDFLLSNKAIEPGDMILAAQLAALQGDPVLAIAKADAAYPAAGATGNDQLDALMVTFRNASPRSRPYRMAFDRLVVLSRGENEVSLPALELIARTPARPRMSDLGNPPLCLAPELDRWDQISQAEVARRLDEHPLASAGDHLLALGLLADQDPAKAEDLVAKATHQFGNGNDDTLGALANWLYDRGEFAKALEILPQERVTRRRDLLLQRINTLDALKRDDEALAALSEENSILDQTLQHVLLAIVRGKTGVAAGSRNEWERALETATSEQEWVVVAGYAEKNGLPDIADAAYEKITSREPDMRYAYVSRLRLAEQSGQTAKAHEIVQAIVERWPNDTASVLHEAYLRLLLGAPTREISQAAEQASARLQDHSRDLGARMVLALADLKLGKRTEALSVLSVSGSGGPLESRPLAVRAAAFAANGWIDQEREESQRLQSEKLLPEERHLLEFPPNE